IILNVDRDNDFGEKAGIAGPVVGYTECYDAAMRLISVDPEDSDSNALFGGLKLYEDLRKENQEIEIALITGDSNVGPKSDTELDRQLEEILGQGKYSDVILVTDGAEDDYIVPLITSRIKMKYVRHVIVRHNQSIESLYYYIVKALSDKKRVNRVIIPVGLVLLTYGIVFLLFILVNAMTTGSILIQPGSWAFNFVAIILGAYFLERGYELRKSIEKLVKDVRTYAQETRISFLSYIVAASLLLIGIASSWVFAAGGPAPFPDQFLLFWSFLVWWSYGAIFSLEAGRGLDLIVSGKRGLDKMLYGLMFSLSIAMVVYGVINYLRYVLGYFPKNVALQEAMLNIGLVVLGIVVAVLSSLVNKYYNDVININNLDISGSER
ncbi:MAG: DUF373 family protein, partial [Candidatus Thermoplasmatota archaeon]|nr:DUF373 family protein [Candidatus Thermoplasmatota archaeon]